jgi:hypothetical protein
MWISGAPTDETYDPEQTAAYSSESFEKFDVSQHRMILGTGPRRKIPTGGAIRGESLKETELIRRLVSKPRLFVRAE